MDAQIGVYRIVRLINRGGQGRVYLGFDTLLRRQVAIKIYDLPARRAARKQLVTEAQLVASLDSPKIVPVYDVIESGSHLAMVMAYVPGCSLEEFLAAARPSLASVITVVTDIAGALAVARQSRIVHGDVKPSNVLLGTDGHARLTDFGIASDQSRQPAAHRSAGSFWSLAPEHVRGEQITEQADIFALGVMLYRMLSLEHPFSADQGQLNLQWLLEHDPVPLAGRVPPEFELPVALEELIDCMLHKDPRQRPTNTRGIRQVLRDCSRNLPMSMGSVLLRESQPFFRPESPDDIPPDIPSELARSGRSRKRAPTRWHEWAGYWYTGLSRRRQWVVLGVASLLVVLSAFSWINSRAVTVAVTTDAFDVAADVALPTGLSRKWLVNTVREATAAAVGRIEPVTQNGELLNVVYAKSARPRHVRPPQEHLALSLRCRAGLCSVSVIRAPEANPVVANAVLFSDASLLEWDNQLSGLVAEVFAHPGQ